jgi:hypothetical protein
VPAQVNIRKYRQHRIFIALLDEREATRRKLTMPLLDDDTHTRWVNDVFEFCHNLKEPSSIEALAFFLVVITSTSEGRLNPKISAPEAMGLLKNHPELIENLRVAWKGRTLREISNLRTFLHFIFHRHG